MMEHNLDRGLPASMEAEKTILGAILLDNNAFNEAAAFIQAEDFYLDGHRKIFTRMGDLVARNCGIDFVTLSNELSKKREVEAVGGVAYISSLIDGVPHQPTIEQYVRIVRDKARQRSLIHAANNAVARCLEQSEDVQETIAGLEAELFDLIARGEKRAAKVLVDHCNDFLNEIAIQRKTPHGQLLGLATDIQELDKLTTGIRAGEMWVIGARPSNGKTALARQIALANGRKGKRVTFFSLEMTATQLIGCSMPYCTDGYLPYFKIRDPRKLSFDQYEELQNQTAELSKLPIHIDDTGGLSRSELMARARMWANKGTDLFIFDYLQMISGHAKEDTLTQVKRASNEIRKLSKDTGIPAVALSQLRKPVAGKTAEPPHIGDLKETGDVEQDAATVLLLHHAPEGVENDRFRNAQINVAKQRFGERDVVLGEKQNMGFDKWKLCFGVMA